MSHLYNFAIMVRNTFGYQILKTNHYVNTIFKININKRNIYNNRR